MPEAKPICFIQYNPKSFILPVGIKITMAEMNGYLAELFKDYYVLAIPEDRLNPENMKMQVFYAKDITEIEIQQLRDKVNEAIENIKNKANDTGRQQY